MWGMFLCDVAIAVAVVAIWYLGWRQVNRRRAEKVMRRVIEVIGDQARVLVLRRRGPSTLEIELSFPTAFQRSWLSIDLMPREMPFHWLRAKLREQKEEVTFRTELEHRPVNNLVIANQKWYGRTSRTAAPPDSCYSLGALVITTREDWQGETTIIERILAARSHEFVQVEFRKRPPHLVVTAPLDSLTQSEDDGGLLGLLRELATCVAAQKE